MHHKVLASTLAMSLLLCQLMGCLAAPSISRQQRSMGGHHGHRDRESKLSVVLNHETENAMLDDTASRLSQTLFGSRRHKRSTSTTISDEAESLLSDESLSPAERRRRRSAAWWISAMVRMCQNHPNTCRRIEVDEGDIHVAIRLQDE